MTNMLNLTFSTFEACFEQKDFDVMRVSPQGKQKFAKFAIGVSKQLWALNPITPAALEEEVKRLALAAIKQAAIRARTAGEQGLQVSYNIIDILQTVMPESAKLTKDEIESWIKANATNLRAFLLSRKHADDVSLNGKVNKLAELLGKASAPNPGWKPVNFDLIIALVEFISVEDAVEGESLDAAPETTIKLLAKVEALAASPLNDADAL
jgi:hypothetical protein